jgi:MFS family permease
VSPGDRHGPLRNRDFRFLFLGRTVTVFGGSIAAVALAFAVLDIGGSATSLGVVLAARSVPQVFFILVGGVVADRLPRHRVMVASDLLSGAAQATTAALVITGAAEIWHLVALQAAGGTAIAFFFPAAQGIVPQTVTPSLLQQANATLRLGAHSSVISGAAAAGVLVAAFGSGWALAIDAGTFLASAALVSRIRLRASERLAGGTMLRELREGWDEFRSRTWLWAIVVQFAFVNAFGGGAWFVLGPVVSKADLGGATAWGVILACSNAGFVLGGLITLRYRPERPLLVATLAILLMVPPWLLLAGPAPTVAIAAAAVVAGMGIELFGVFWDLSMQQNIPAEKLSRVYAYDALGSFVFIPLGYSAMGPIAEAIGIRETLFLASAIAVASTLAVLAVPDVRNLRRKHVAAEEPATVGA